MKISIIIVNYNGEKFIENCLDSILNSKTDIDYEIIIVDNNSTDHSLAILDRYKSSCMVIQNMNNSGFSKANNIGVSFATGDYYFFLNNDTLIKQDTLSKLVQLFSEKETVDVIIPKLLNEDGSLQCPGSSLGKHRFKSTQPCVIPFAAGAAFFISQKAYDTVGGFDNSYFFYNEDLDLSKSLKRHGYPIYYDPRVSIVHFGGLSTGFRRYHSIIEGYRGGFYFCGKFYGIIILQLYRLLMLIYSVIKLLIHAALIVFNSKHKETVLAYLKVIEININNDFQFKHPTENVKVLS